MAPMWETAARADYSVRLYTCRVSSSGQVLIVGSAVSSLVKRLEAQGYVCSAEAAKDIEGLSPHSRPDVIVLATPARSTSGTLQRIRKHLALKSVPVLIESKTPTPALEALEVDGVASTHEELERLIAASIRARRLIERERLVRSRLELLLEVSRSRQPFKEVASAVAGRLLTALGCEDVSVLVLEGEGPRKAFLIGVKAKTPVDLAVAPMLRKALESRQSVETDGIWVYPCSTEAQGIAAFVLKRAAAFDAEESDFLNAVAVALTHTLEHEHAQATVNKTRESLEAAYLDRYRELAEANRRLNALDRRKNEMLAVLSHDLRAPLNVLIGHSWMLLDDAKLSNAHRPSVEAIQRTSKKVLELVETLLEKSRGEDGHIVLFTKTMDVAETCQEAVRDLQILAKQNNLTLRIEAPMSLMVLGDEQKIRQVLQNLITNALKHARGATQIVVRARVKPRAEGRNDGPVALVEVKDDGQVKDPNDLLLAFERSTGLGLSICRDFVERHGGEIWAEAPSDGGAAFAFTLPMTRETVAPNPNRKTDAPVILLVEDDPVFARVCSLGLSGHYRVEVARDGNEGLSRAAQLKPDIIVMDLFMPNRDGLDTLKELQANPVTATIPVVLISAHPELGTKLKSMDLGNIDYLTKPFPLNTLLTKVNSALRRSTVLLQSGPGNDRETGLFDHVGVVNRLDQEMSRSVRYARPLTLVVLKPTMPPGDRVKALAGIVRRELRAPDVVGHLGNGVLVTILPETPTEAARPLIGRLCGLLQDHGVAYRSRLVDVRDDSQTAEHVLEQLLS